MNDKGIVMLASKGESTLVIYNALKHDHNILAVIMEEPMSMSHQVKRRLKKLGIWRVSGQVLFKLFVPPILNLTSKKRIEEISKIYAFDKSEIPQNKIINVGSVNDDECLAHLQRLDPALVVINGTRIISPVILNAVKAVFLNVHVGITPEYRGVHGGYWALVNNDAANCGVTVHLVDQGIDTGGVILQKAITPEKQDNFVTYPLLQLGEAIPLLKMAVTNGLSGNLALKQKAGKGKLWHHPTIWQYLSHRFRHGKR